MSSLRDVDQRAGRDLWIATAAMLVALACFPWSAPGGTSWVFVVVSAVLALLSVFLLVAARRRLRRPDGTPAPLQKPAPGTDGNQDLDFGSSPGPDRAHQPPGGGGPATPPDSGPAPVTAPAPAPGMAYGSGSTPAGDLPPVAVADAPRARPMTVLAELAALLSLVVSVIQLFVDG
ncbi:hypothetical protein [Streptomyces meridianus]|uniref:Uncharacterized protein n=1 Tax=Streptomyces meridianus TaxID=2938945 RepID=A0ABT0X4B7_9ACTN|nr:hypothetical protein [Streptomyces meridianus]MCM2577386.1 hypothetical protein [Streptomyces meridianus]